MCSGTVQPPRLRALVACLCQAKNIVNRCFHYINYYILFYGWPLNISKHSPLLSPLLSVDSLWFKGTPSVQNLLPRIQAKLYSGHPCGFSLTSLCVGTVRPEQWSFKRGVDWEKEARIHCVCTRLLACCSIPDKICSPFSESFKQALCPLPQNHPTRYGGRIRESISRTSRQLLELVMCFSVRSPRLGTKPI